MLALYLAILVSTAYRIQAKSILGMAYVGGVSHQTAVARVGLELQARGHSFTMLVSQHDAISRAKLDKGPFNSIRKVHFKGASHIGTQDWLRSLARGSLQV